MTKLGDIERKTLSLQSWALFQSYVSFDFPQVSGPYLTQYEVYYKRLDPNGENKIGALDAATFLKKSGLSDETLGKVGVILKRWKRSLEHLFIFIIKS